MNDVHQLPDLKQVEQASSDWIARMHADDVSAQDRSRFEAWYGAHPMHARAYDERMQLMREYMAAGPMVRAVAFAQSMNAAAATEPGPWRKWLTAACVCMATAVLGVYYMLHVAPGRSFSTMVGEQAKISLPDGSMMELNSNSVARVQFTEDRRLIRLERGEAFFKVAHDERRPFWVAGNGSWVRAVGTQFNVLLRSEGVRVTVSEGRVKVGTAKPLAVVPSEAELAGTANSLLDAGQQMDVSRSALTTRRLSPAELAQLVAWRDGTLIFQNRSLADVVDELDRYTAVHMVIADDKLKTIPVGGSFQANPQGADALLALLEHGFGLSIRREGNNAYIESSKD